VLEEHLDSGRPDAWRSACKIIEHSWGRPPDPLNEIAAPVDVDPLRLSELSTPELVALARREREKANGSLAEPGSSELKSREAVEESES